MYFKFSNVFNVNIIKDKLFNDVIDYFCFSKTLHLTSVKKQHGALKVINNNLKLFTNNILEARDLSSRNNSDNNLGLKGLSYNMRR